MIIKTSQGQDAALRQRYKAIVHAHHAEGCEPPGFTLKVRLGLPAHYGCDAVDVCSGSRLELGDVAVA